MVDNCYSSVNVVGYNVTGGFAGYNNGEIINSYSVGLVDGVAAFGGFVGDTGVADIILNSFWDTETSGQLTSAGDEVGKTTLEMQTLSTFTDATWDFDTIWEYSEDNYPQLLAFAEEDPGVLELTVGDGYNYSTLASALAVALEGDTIFVKETYDDTLETYPVVFPAVENLTVDCEESRATFTHEINTSNYFEFNASTTTIQNCNFEDVGIDFHSMSGNILSNDVVLNEAVGVGTLEASFIGSSHYDFSGSNISYNSFAINYSAGYDNGDSGSEIIGSIMGTESEPSIISYNSFVYNTVPIEYLGYAIKASGGILTISYNSFRLPEGEYNVEWDGISIRPGNDSPDESYALITHNTLYVGSIIGNGSDFIQMYDCISENDDTYTMEADITYNAVISNVADNSGAISVQKNCVGTTMSANIDYNGTYNFISPFSSFSEYSEEIGLNIGDHNIDKNPLFKEDSLELEPFSSYLDVDGNEDIGAISGVRGDFDEIVIDDDGVIDYVNVHANTLDILDGLQDGTNVSVLAGTYGGFQLVGQSELTITGVGVETIVVAEDSSNGITLENSDDNIISNMLIRDADDVGHQYLAGHSIFSYGGHDMTTCMGDGEGECTLFINGDLVIANVSEDDTDISIVISNAGATSWNLVIADISESSRLGFFVPADVWDTAELFESLVSWPSGTIDRFIQDVLIYDDGDLIYDPEPVALAGVTIKGGTTDPFYITHNNINYAGLKFAGDSYDNIITDVILDNNSYGVWFSGEGGSNIVIPDEINNSLVNVAYSDATGLGGDANFLGNITYDQYEEALVTGDRGFGWIPMFSAYVVGTDGEVEADVEVTFTNEITSNTVTSGVDGYTGETGLPSLSQNVDGPLADFSSYTITVDAFDEYDAFETTRVISENGQIFHINLLDPLDEGAETGTRSVYRICTDGTDNDLDGVIDYPDDPGCENVMDAEEENTVNGSKEDKIHVVEEPAEQVTEEAESFLPLFPTPRIMENEKEALKEFINRFQRLPEDTEWWNIHFIAYGNEQTKDLAIRFRSGLLEDFYVVYSRLPIAEIDWLKLTQMYRGVVPEVSIMQEELAAQEFKTIYNRLVNLLIPQEKKFIDMVAYHLRPQERNIEQEKTALQKFVHAYNRLPDSSNTWSILRAIAYSLVQ